MTATMERRLAKPRLLEGVRGPLLLVVLAAFGFDLALQPPHSAPEVVLRAVSFAVFSPLFLLFGMWLGRRSWPRRGRRLARHVLKRAFRQETRPLVFLTDRPDVAPHLGRRILEVVGFAAGGSVVVAALLPLLGFDGVNVLALAALLSLFAVWASFVLVPYWLFARMGLRQVDPVRWMVEPVSRRYAGRLRLSNGALLLVALGASVNLAFRAGASGEAALVDGVRVLVSLVASIFLIAASAVVFYSQKEKGLVKEFEAEVLGYGIRDGRGMTDGDFLPRLPGPKGPP